MEEGGKNLGLMEYKILTSAKDCALDVEMKSVGILQIL